jgi:Holliday junction resolvase RusA-like endonuclease
MNLSTKRIAVVLLTYWKRFWMTILLNIKPLSVNEAYQGRKFKTPAYKAFEQALMLMLPNDFKVPAEGDLEVIYEFGISKNADGDNCIKAFQDVLQTKYSFNDSRIVKWIVIKNVVKKGDGYINFAISEVK